jgi:hypothetical protein
VNRLVWACVRGCVCAHGRQCRVVQPQAWLTRALARGWGYRPCHGCVGTSVRAVERWRLCSHPALHSHLGLLVGAWMTWDSDARVWARACIWVDDLVLVVDRLVAWDSHSETHLYSWAPVSSCLIPLESFRAICVAGHVVFEWRGRWCLVAEEIINAVEYRCG